MVVTIWLLGTGRVQSGRVLAFAIRMRNPPGSKKSMALWKTMGEAAHAASDNIVKLGVKRSNLRSNCARLKRSYSRFQLGR